MDYMSPPRILGLEEQRGIASGPTAATRKQNRQQLTGNSLQGPTVRSSQTH